MSDGYHDDIAPNEIEPLHSPNVPALYRDLVRSMKKNGWKGRPLLVIECANGSFVAWTGSHRIAAAREAGLDSIPCYIIPESLIESDSIDARTGHVMDFERIRAINASGDETAIHLMSLEKGFA